MAVDRYADLYLKINFRDLNFYFLQLRSLVELTRMNGSSNLGDIIPLTIALQDLLHFPKLPTKTIKNIAELWRRFRPIGKVKTK